VSTALPIISSTFKALDTVEWVGTAYMLPMTSCQLVFGKLASIYGRKTMLITSIIIFLIGSALAGAAQNFIMLCVSRAIQGIGGAGIAPSVMMTISDLVTLRERGKYQSVVALCWATGSAAGPVVGGALADRNWRWIFFINLPIGVIALLLLIVFLRIPDNDESKGTWWKQLRRIDFIGASTFIASVVCFLLATQWGGVRYPWSSAIVIVLYVIALILLILTIIVSWKLSSEPMLELDMFYDHARSALYIAVVAIASAMFVNIFYLPIYFQVANGDSPLIAGAEMLSFLVPVDLISVISGFIVSMTGHYKIMFLVGSILIAIGGGLQTMLTIDSGRAAQVCYQVLSGAGIGFCIQK
ncbi:MFS general substrate transporter, partial [Lichtheimia hyalospora FSU 10163]